MNDEILTKDIFCASEQTTTSHAGSVDDNGEFVFTCQTEGCGRSLKFAADTTPEQFAVALKQHEATSSGQVDVSKQKDKLKALLGVSLQDAEPSSQPDDSQPDNNQENTTTVNSEQPAQPQE